MTSDQKARMAAVQRRQRESYQKLFDIQGQTIDALREALSAVARTQDEMAKLFMANNEADDILGEP